MAIPITMPRQGQSVETCVILEWHKKKGDAVKEGDILFTYETDKASFEFESPSSGLLLETFFDEGADVPVLTNVGAVGSEGESVDEFRPAEAPPQAATAPAAPEPAAKASSAAPEPVAVQQTVPVEPSGEQKASPRAKKRASEIGVAMATIAGTGPGGRVIERDVLAAAQTAPSMTRTAQAQAASGALAAPPVGTGIGGRVRAEDLVPASSLPQQAVPLRDEVTEIKLSKIRTIIADRMMASLQQSAQLTMNAYANATSLMALRAKLKAKRESLGIENITITDLVAFALVKTLARFPEVNALFSDNALRQYKRVHLAVAVDTPRGLMVPVVRFADALSLNTLAGRIKQLAQQCVDGSINPDFLQGGTITMSNLGVYGIDSFTPVLNPPQVALCGVNAISPRPVAGSGGQYEIVPHIGLSLTIDHRAVDGAPGARFLKALVDALENIELTIAQKELI